MTISATLRRALGIALSACVAVLLLVPTSAGAGERKPTACFTQSPAGSVSTGQTVTFDSSCSRQGEGGIAFRAWDLDDDGQFDDSNETIVTRAFPSPGRYRIRLVVFDGEGERSVATRTVMVTNWAPTAAFSESPSSPVAGESVTFTSTSTDFDGSIVGHRWALDADGAFDDGTGTSVTRAFSEPGTYSIKLEVTDDDGATAIVTRTISVSPPPPPPPPPVTPVAPVAPLRFLDPFPIVRLRGRTTGRGARLSLFTVRAPHGSRVALGCTGAGCPARRVRKTIRTSTGQGSRTIHISRFERFLRAGTVIRVTVTQPGMVGKYARIRIRRIAVPVRTDRCLLPGSGRPAVCPGTP